MLHLSKEICDKMFFEIYLYFLYNILVGNICVFSGAADMYTGRPLTVPMSVPMPNGVGAPPPVEAYAGSIMKLPPPPQSKLCLM